MRQRPFKKLQRRNVLELTTKSREYVRRPPLRTWQIEARSRWEHAGNRGIVEAVTGSGKTVFALACIEKLEPDTSIIVVPTVALLDQWWEEAANYFGLALDEVHVVSGGRSVRTGTINLVVLNTASKILKRNPTHGALLIVDECHKAASPEFRAALDIPTRASLGLSATPERPYDDGLTSVLVPALGPLIYQYNYADALKDGVIVPFNLRNIIFELEEDRQKDYDRLTRRIAQAVEKYGATAHETVSLLLRRARILNLSLNRIRLTARLVGAHTGKRVLVFHEDIEAAELIHKILFENQVASGVYHSKLTLRQRAEVLSQYRQGQINVLVTCKALDEGFNVPDSEIAVIAASTATRRQRIQRMGRILRPAGEKSHALIYTLVATRPEIARLKDEETDLTGVAEVSWVHA